MKHTRRTAWVLAMGGMLLIASCQEKTKPQEDSKTTKESAEIEEKISKPDGIISLEEAKTLCDNYEDRRLGIIKKFESSQDNVDEGFIPTQFVTFDFKTIERYIKYVKRKSRRAGVKPDSLRIYFGNYGTDGREPNKNTVFLLPATTIDNQYGGYYIENKKAKLIRDHWPTEEDGNPKSKASFAPNFPIPIIFQDGQSLVLNHGNSAPPPPGDF